MWINPVLYGKHYSFGIVYQLLTVFHLFFCILFSLCLGRRICWRHPINSWMFQNPSFSLCNCPVVGTCVNDLLRLEDSYWGLSKLVTKRYDNMPFYVFSLLCSISRIKIVSLPLRPMRISGKETQIQKDKHCTFSLIAYSRKAF